MNIVWQNNRRRCDDLRGARNGVAAVPVYHSAMSNGIFTDIRYVFGKDSCPSLKTAIMYPVVNICQAAEYSGASALTRDNQRNVRQFPRRRTGVFFCERFAVVGCDDDECIVWHLRHQREKVGVHVSDAIGVFFGAVGDAQAVKRGGFIRIAAVVVDSVGVNKRKPRLTWRRPFRKALQRLVCVSAAFRLPELAKSPSETEVFRDEPATRKRGGMIPALLQAFGQQCQRAWDLLVVVFNAVFMRELAGEEADVTWQSPRVICKTACVNHRILFRPGIRPGHVLRREMVSAQGINGYEDNVWSWS